MRAWIAIAARRGNLLLREMQLGERLARREQQLRLHDIDAGDFFGHRMLDLQARIRLDEREGRLALAASRIDEELEGAEAVVADFLRELHRRCGQAIAHLRRQRRARRDFDDLLVAPLDAAFALPQMAHRASAVADDLHLDVTRAWHQLLDIDVAVAERRARLGLAALVCFFELIEMMDDAHPAAAATCDRFDHDRGAAAE